jgi:hypothetical protein
MNAKVENQQANEKIAELEARIAALEAKVLKPKGDTREMTADDARRVLTGDMRDMSHKAAAAALGLSYGQIYSCRLEFTFKPVHAEMKATGQKNRWTVKK